MVDQPQQGRSARPGRRRFFGGGAYVPPALQSRLPSARPSGMQDAEVEFILGEARKVVDAQWESADRLSNRAATLITVGVSILTGALIVFVTSPNNVAHIFPVLAAFLALGSIGTATGAYLVTGFWYPPNKFELTPDNRWSALVGVANAYFRDRGFLRRRQILVNVSLVLFAGSLVELLAGIVIYLA